jgi:hypothetical protein
MTIQLALGILNPLVMIVVAIVIAAEKLKELTLEQIRQGAQAAGSETVA